MRDSHEIDGHKLDLHIDRVYEWKFRGDTTPIYVEISPTAQCNHHCSFCALEYINHTNERIPRQKMIDIGTQLSKLGVRGVMFAGEGEPTLHPQLPEIIGHYHDSEIDTALTTNGALLNGEFALEGGEFLKWIKVSINGGDAETYNRVHSTSPGSFERVWSNIREFRAACKTRIPVVGVQAVAIKDNFQSLSSLCERAITEKLDYVVIKPFSPNSYAEGNSKVEQPDPDELRLILDKCSSLSTNKTKIVTRDRAFQSVESTPSYQHCLSVPFFWLYINSNAEVVACSNHMKDQRFILGNLYTQTIQDIWYSHAKDMREKLKKVMRDFDISQCRKACRMDRVNEWLWRIANPGSHRNFI